MKISVSLSEHDVRRLDDYMRTAGLPSRSAAVQQAIRSLADAELETAYVQAWAEWEQSGDAETWAGAASDGLDHASW